jgi:hypothetical protein
MFSYDIDSFAVVGGVYRGVLVVEVKSDWGLLAE